MNGPVTACLAVQFKVTKRDHRSAFTTGRHVRLTEVAHHRNAEPLKCDRGLTDLQRRFHVPATSRLDPRYAMDRSEEHTSELQSRGHLVCRPLLEKKNK